MVASARRHFGISVRGWAKTSSDNYAEAEAAEEAVDIELYVGQVLNEETAAAPVTNHHVLYLINGLVSNACFSLSRNVAGEPSSCQAVQLNMMLCQASGNCVG